MDGTTPRTTVNSFLRVNKVVMSFSQVDTKYKFTQNAGNIYFHKEGDLTKMYEFMPYGTGITSSIKYSVPKNYQSVIKDIQISGYTNANHIQLLFYVNRFNTGGVNTLEYQVDLNDLTYFNKNILEYNLFLDEYSEFFCLVKTPSSILPSDNKINCFVRIEEYLI